MAKKYRDGLFRSYFSDKKRLLGLCNLLTGENATDPDEIKINTLDGIFFGELKNDISCLFRGKFLVIIEHQATINENMPLRILFYAAELLRQFVDEQKEKIYLEKLVPLPKPQFYVFYNGRKKEAERRVMRLSDAFGEYTCLEVVVQMYNLNAGMNAEFISSDESLNNYCAFVNLYQKFLAEGVDSDHAFKATFDYCIGHGIMADYLKTIKKELASMLALEYDPELDRKAWHEKGLEEGLKVGREEGRKKGRKEERFVLVKNLLKAKTPIEYIITATGWSKEKILEVGEHVDVGI